jgi:hypothetical protein
MMCKSKIKVETKSKEIETQTEITSDELEILKHDDKYLDRQISILNQRICMRRKMENETNIENFILGIINIMI